MLREALALVRPARACRGGVKASLKIAAQHQAVGAHFPALQPVEEAHGRAGWSHLPRGTTRLDRMLDQPADREAVERQPGGAGCCRRRFPP